MGARQRLNSQYLLGAVVLAAVLGGVTESGLVFVITAALAALWLCVALTMLPPPKVAARSYPVHPAVDLDELRAKIVELPGVREAVVETESRMAHLKINLDRWDEARLQQLIGAD